MKEGWGANLGGQVASLEFWRAMRRNKPKILKNLTHHSTAQGKVLSALKVPKENLGLKIGGSDPPPRKRMEWGGRPPTTHRVSGLNLWVVAIHHRCLPGRGTSNQRTSHSGRQQVRGSEGPGTRHQAGQRGKSGQGQGQGWDGPGMVLSDEELRELWKFERPPLATRA